MLRGTVYTVIGGVIVKRVVMSLPVATPGEFRQEAARLYHLASAQMALEFGPIGEPWGRLPPPGE